MTKVSSHRDYPLITVNKNGIDRRSGQTVAHVAQALRLLFCHLCVVTALLRRAAANPA